MDEGTESFEVELVVPRVSLKLDEVLKVVILHHRPQTHQLVLLHAQDLVGKVEPVVALLGHYA